MPEEAEEVDRMPRGREIEAQAPSARRAKVVKVALANKQVDVMVRIAAEFGMTPSSRSRIRTAERPPDDPFEAFLERRHG